MTIFIIRLKHKGRTIGRIVTDKKLTINQILELTPQSPGFKQICRLRDQLKYFKMKLKYPNINEHHSKNEGDCLGSIDICRVETDSWLTTERTRRVC